MRLEELVSQNYNRLNENDLLIWSYVQQHKSMCCNIGIEELAKACSISRTTISRFTQKLSFEGFREFKLHLKMECEADGCQSDILLEDIFYSYQKCIEQMRTKEITEICERIYKAERLFALGTGEVQNNAIQMMKQMFMNVQRFFVTMYGKSEAAIVTEDIRSEDFVIVVSMSGENEIAVEAVRRLKAKGVYILSITRLSNNTVAKLSDKNLFIMTNTLLNKGTATFETCSSFFNIVELLCVRYMMYLKEIEDQN